VDVHHVSPDYFSTLRIPLLRGRLPTDADQKTTPWVVVLSEAAAQKYFPNGDALGAVVGLEQEQDLTVIGIVGNVRLDGPERPHRPEAYIPLAQGRVSGADLVIRASGDPRALEPMVRAAMWAVEPSALIPEGRTLEASLQRIIAPRKFNMLLFSVLGVFAIAIAATGIYGLLAQQVERRRSEMGLRIALGARPVHILTLVFRRAVTYLGWGLVAGVVASVYLASFVESFLFQMTPYDTPAYVVAGAFLFATGLVAAIIPAIRAMRVDPIVTLKTG
jgi:putative ABC transport system permease protein